MKNIITQLNKTFDNKVRLGIMSVLIVNDWVDFRTLKEVLDLTDGRLASHIKGLEGEGFIEVRKQFIGNKPNTSYSVTIAGRNAFDAHLDALEELLKIRE